MIAQKSAEETPVSNKCWDFPTESTPDSPLVSDTTNIYFAAAGGRITAIDAATGKSAWNAELGGRAISNIVVRGTDIIAVTAAIDDGGKLRSASLRSLSKVTGIVNWTAEIPSSEKYYLGVSSNGIIAVSDTGSAAAFALRDGSAGWSRPASGQLAAKPDIDEEYTVIPLRAGRTVVLSTKTGEQVSTIESPANVET